MKAEERQVSMKSSQTEVGKTRRHVPSKPEPERRMGMAGIDEIDSRSLERDLAQEIRGEVRFDRGSLGLYATDSSNYRQVPIGVVVPRTLEDVVVTHQICSRHRVPLLNRGGGTSLSGETVNVAVIIDHSKYLTKIGEPDAVRRMVTVETGAINEKVNEATGKVGFVFGPDPSTHAYCTIGGNLGNNSCGIHSVQSQLYGPGPRTSDNVHAMEVVTYAGDRFWVGVGEEAELGKIIAQGGAKGAIYEKLRDLRDRHARLIRARMPTVTELPRRISGYNLDELLPENGFNVARALVGTESTCATVLQATLLLTPGLFKRVTMAIAYEDIESAATHAPEIMDWRPIAIEAIDDRLFRDEEERHIAVSGLEMLPLPGQHAWLLVEFGADDQVEAVERAKELADWLAQKKGYSRDRIRIYEGDEKHGLSKGLWQVREGGLGATAFPPDGHDHWPGWEDSAVPPAKVGDYIGDLKRLYKKHDLAGAMYGHIGQGCVHSRISFDLRSESGIRNYRKFLDEASDLVASYKGSLSGEHGDGQQRAEFLEKQYGPELLGAMREFKLIWDPAWKMNPGKVIDPYRVDQNLKLGKDYNPPRPDVKFSYAADNGDFAHAMLRCVGVGKCRQPDGVDVMCPSYIVTREEKHTTRGRARLLFEMLQGDVIRDGWQSKEVHDALDLCLACKGCTSDCPVHVDMPTYKAEFLYHYYQSLRRNRTRSMYMLGFVDKWARIASAVPELVNFASQTPGLSYLAKLIAGMDRRRPLPKFAPMSLQKWFKRRGGTVNKMGSKVVLWPDTFNNYLDVSVGVACVEALEAAGFAVVMPMEHVCCGRPLYDFGFLGMAERYLRHTLKVLREELRNDVPIVGMEPSCLAVFRHELPSLLPHDDDGKRLTQNSYHFAEFFLKHGVQLPALERKALVWGHCHQKATGGIEPEKKLLQEGMGMTVELAKGGCCGLAGSFGFENGKHDISMKCGEVGFLPAVRKADTDTVIVADGFSCKTQLSHAGIGREALHTAEVIKMARDYGAAGMRGPRPEEGREPPPAPPMFTRVARTGAAVAAMVLVATSVFALARRLRCGRLTREPPASACRVLSPPDSFPRLVFGRIRLFRGGSDHWSVRPQHGRAPPKAEAWAPVPAAPPATPAPAGHWSTSIDLMD
jgi:FAD/FMN-containing dehydrogenase/Fe-S oxidoreductase